MAEYGKHMIRPKRSAKAGWIRGTRKERVNVEQNWLLNVMVMGGREISRAS